MFTFEEYTLLTKISDLHSYAVFIEYSYIALESVAQKKRNYD